MYSADMGYTQVFSEIPSKITAGTSVSWAVSLPDFPATEGWTLTYSLVYPSVQIVVTSTPSGDAHLFEIPLADSAEWTPGKYSWQSHISNGTERYLIDSGSVEILADYAAATAGSDTRTWLDKAIEALQASIAGRASKTQMTQVVAGVQVQHMTLDAQIDALKRLKALRASSKRKLKNIMRTRKVAF